MNNEQNNKAEVARLLRRLRRNVTAINQVLVEARKIYPEANLYLDGTGNLSLMSGPHHDDCGIRSLARQDTVLGDAKLDADCGDW